MKMFGYFQAASLNSYAKFVQIRTEERVDAFVKDCGFF